MKKLVYKNNPPTNADVRVWSICTALLVLLIFATALTGSVHPSSLWPVVGIIWVIASLWYLGVMTFWERKEHHYWRRTTNEYRPIDALDKVGQYMGLFILPFVIWPYASLLAARALYRLPTGNTA